MEGLERSKHRDKRMKAARGPAGKAIVAGVKDRERGQAAAGVVPDASARTLTKVVHEHSDPLSTVFADEGSGYLPYSKMGYDHCSVRHSVGEYLDNEVLVKGMESSWSLVKRGCHNTYHQISHEHLDRCVQEVKHRHNSRSVNTIHQMGKIVADIDYKRLTKGGLIRQGPHTRKRKEVAA